MCSKAASLDIAGSSETLGTDDFVFVDRGVTHGLRNESIAPVRWFEASAPQPGASLEDIVFVTGAAPAVDADPPYRRGHFDPAELPPPSSAILTGFGAANVGGADSGSVSRSIEDVALRRGIAGAGFEPATSGL